MATLAFKPYTYKPTAPRSKGTVTRRRPAPEQVSILNKLQHIISSSASLSTPQPIAAAAAGDGGGYRPEIRGTGTVDGGSDKANNDESDDDRDLPTIEELLFTKLQAQGFTIGDRGPDKTGRVEEVAADERGGSVDQSRSVQSNNSGGSSDDPIVLLGDGNSSASEAKANDVSLRAESVAAPGAGLFDNPEIAINSTTPAPPRSSDRWHDIDDFPGAAPRLRSTEQGASTPDSPAYTPSSHLSSELLHDSISTDSAATSPSSSPPPRHRGASPKTRLSQDGRLHTGRSVVAGHELVEHTLDTLLINREVRKQQEAEQEQEKDEGSSKDEDEGPQQEMSIVAPVVTVERAGGSPTPANRRPSLPNLEPSLEPSDSDDELNRPDSDRDDEKEPRPAKRKQPSSSHHSSTPKKRRRRLQQSPQRRRRSLSEPHRQYPKYSSPDQRSRGGASSRAKGRLPSPAPSTTQSIHTTMSPGLSSRATSPTLTEITFRPHSAHCYSFTATIWDGYDGRGVCLTQLARLIANTGHVGKIDDFTIKPIDQHSYLLSGFSRHTSSSITAEVRHWSQKNRAVDARTLEPQMSEPSSSDDDDDDDESGINDSDPDPGSDSDGCSSEGELGRSATRMNVPWEPLEEQRLLAYKKENKPWDWIFKKFPGRTRPAVRTRWTMVQRRGD